MKRVLSLSLFFLWASGVYSQDLDSTSDEALSRKCLEAGPIDSNKFISSTHLDLSKRSWIFSSWELAELISHRNKHDHNDPLWILQLICREDATIMEREPAIIYAYDAWKADTILNFKVCDYASTTMGFIYCVGREADSARHQYNEEIKALAGKLNKAASKQLMSASDAFLNFTASHVAHEEGLGGTGYSGFCMESEMKEQEDFMALIQTTYSRSKPSSWPPSPEADSTLNTVYQQVQTELKGAESPLQPGTPTVESVRETERLWLVYRDNTATFFNALQPKVSVAQWRNWLTERRIIQLRNLGNSPD